MPSGGGSAEERAVVTSVALCRDAKLCLTPNGTFTAIARGAKAHLPPGGGHAPLVVLATRTLELVAVIPHVAPSPIVTLHSLLSSRPPTPPPADAAAMAAAAAGAHSAATGGVGGGQQHPFAVVAPRGGAAQYGAAAAASDVAAQGDWRGDSSAAWIIAGLGDGRSASWPIGVFTELHTLRAKLERI